MKLGEFSDRNKLALTLAAMLGIGANAIPTYSLGLFLAPLSQEFGWTRAQVSLAVTITAATVMLASPFVGRLIDRIGARRTVLTGSALGGIAIASVCLATDYRWYVAAWVAAGLAMSFSSPLVWTVPIARTFSTNRGLALSIAFSGTNLTGMIAPLTSAALIQAFGWRYAWAGISGLYLVMSLPLAILFFRDPGPARTAATAEGPVVARPGKNLREAVATREFWLFAGSFLLAGSSVMAIVMHFVPALTDGGLARYEAAGALSALSLSALAGRIGSGWLFDRVFIPRLAALTLAFPAAGCLALATGITSGLLPYLYAVLIGLAVGAEMNVASLLTARYFGFKAFAAIYGLLFGIFALGYTLGPVMAGFLYDIGGSYRLPLMVLAAGFAGSATLLLLCRRYPEFESAAPLAA